MSQYERAKADLCIRMKALKENLEGSEGILRDGILNDIQRLRNERAKLYGNRKVIPK